MVELTEKERLLRAVKSLRTYLRDKRELNRLLLGQYESSDEDLRMAIIHALMDWNTTPPHTGNTRLSNHPAKHLLIEGAAIEALKTARLWHSREHMPSSDGGTSADDHAKAGEYDVMIDRLTQDYERKKGDYKTAQNITAALGNQGAPSEYSFYYDIFEGDDVW